MKSMILALAAITFSVPAFAQEQKVCSSVSCDDLITAQNVCVVMNSQCLKGLEDQLKLDLQLDARRNPVAAKGPSNRSLILDLQARVAELAEWQRVMEGITPEQWAAYVAPPPVIPYNDADMRQQLSGISTRLLGFETRIKALEDNDAYQDHRLDLLEAADKEGGAPLIRGGLGFGGGYLGQVPFHDPGVVTGPGVVIWRPEADLRIDFWYGTILQMRGYGTFGSDATMGGGGEFYLGHWLGESAWEAGGTAGYDFHAVYGKGLHSTSPLADYSGVSLGARLGVEPFREAPGLIFHLSPSLGFVRANDGYAESLRALVPQPSFTLGVTYFFPGAKASEQKTVTVYQPVSPPAPAPVIMPPTATGDMPVSAEAMQAIREALEADQAAAARSAPP